MNGDGSRSAVVIEPGLLSTVQDLGRTGMGAQGVSPSGAADWFSARAANRLVGNSDDAPLVETTLSAASFDVRCDVTIAVTGADVPLTIGGRGRACWRSWPARAGDRISLGPAVRGVRAYLAFAGGLVVTRVMGSASTDVGGGFGGRVLRTGDTLTLGVVEGEVRPQLAYLAGAVPTLGGRAVLRAVLGPHADLVGASVVNDLFSREYRASVRSSRQALRLEGEAFALPVAASGVSTGVCAGCMQLTGDGLGVIMLAEHQTTGGYPVAVCVVWADVARAAQIRPGDTVRFERVDFGGARAALAVAIEKLRTLRPALAGIERERQDEREQQDEHGPQDEHEQNARDERLAGGFFEGA